MKLTSKIISHTNFRSRLTLATVAAVLGAFLLIGATSPGFYTELISIGTDGQAGGGDSYYVASEIRAGAVSADGRYVVFSSLADSLTSDDVSSWQVYLRDRETGTTTLVSDTGEDTVYGSTSEGNAVISADGRFVAFQSTNGQLVENDTNGSADIFVYDRTDESIKRVSVASDGSESCACSCGWPDTCNGCEYHWVNSHPSISADGRYITFTSFSYNFVDGDLPDTPDVFVHDQQTGTTTIVSRASDGSLGNASSGEPSISADGNFIAFSSKANNLIAEDWNDQLDVFLWCRDTGSLTRVSISTDGSEGNSYSSDPVINEDGSLIAFTSGATSLAAPDSNGFTYDIFLHDRGHGITSILSSGLAAGSSRPAISSDGEYVSFTSGTDDIYLLNIEDGTRQLIDNNMQFSALDEEGETVVVSGYASLVAEDNNGDKDVYVISTAYTEPPTDPEICNDGVDNDGDGLTDCLDKLDCRQDPACKTGGGGGGGSGGGGSGGGGGKK